MTTADDAFPNGLASDDYEEQHVHSVYEAIAPHFSSTRYKVRPPSHSLEAASSTCLTKHSHGP